MTWKERWAELKRIYGGDPHREVRHTAVGWNPGGWQEDPGPTPSGNREYYTVVREGEPATEEPAKQRTSLTPDRQGQVWTAEEILRREG